MAGIIGQITDKKLSDLGLLTKADIGRREASQLAAENEADMSIQTFTAPPILDPLRTQGNVQFAPFIGSANEAAPESPGADFSLTNLFGGFFTPGKLGTPGFTPGDDPGIVPPLVRTEGIVLGDPAFTGPPIPNVSQGAGDIRRARQLQIAGLVLLGAGAIVLFNIFGR